jgi:hypothetical protein
MLCPRHQAQIFNSVVGLVFADMMQHLTALWSLIARSDPG